MILANEAVGALLADRRRDALFRVHEPPDPQAIGLLLAKLADLDVPTPPAPGDEHMTRREAAALAGAISERVTAYVEQSGRGREAFRIARPACAEAGALRPTQPRPHGARKPRVLPLHVADPPLLGPRLPPRAAARARRLGRAGRAGRSLRGRRAHLGDRARRRQDRAPRRRHLPRLAARARAVRARLGGAVRRRDHRRDRLGRLRALRRRLRGLRARPAASPATTSS